MVQFSKEYFKKNPINIEDISLNEEIPTKEYVLTRGDLVNYAGVAGDPNPIHFSDVFASKVGLDGVVVHGMLIMGLVADFVSNWTGNPGLLSSFNVRFSNPLVVPKDASVSLAIGGKVKSISEDNVVELIIEVKSGDIKILTKTIASIKF